MSRIDLTRLRILVVNSQPDLDLQRNAVAHAALLALLLIVFVLQADRLAAVFADVDDVELKVPHCMTETSRRQRAD